MSLHEDTAAIQEQLARFCRDGETVTIPGAHSAERVAVYRDLIFNNIEDQLRLAFPILASALPAKDWADLVRAFFAKHPCPDPQLWRMPYELVRFIRDHQLAQTLKRPYLDDLVRFEWVEIELFMTADLPAPLTSPVGSVLDDPVVLNPLFRLNRFQYPVFRVPPAALLDHAGEYYLLSFRHPERCTVQFIELAPVSVRTVEILSTHPCSGRAALLQAGEELCVTDQASLLTQGEAFLQTLVREGAALGFLREEKICPS